MLKYMKISLVSLILAISFINPVKADIHVVINELMASNSNCIQDPQGQYDDWIELYNWGSSDIDLGGLYLTDDLSAPAKWQIPAATTIPAGGYLLIWADNNTADDGLHANFKLDADGEEIGLFDSDGITLINSMTFPEQDTNVSYGRYPDAAEDWRYFGTPSPAAQNEGGYLGEVEDPTFSHHRGFYDQPFSLTIATETADAIIYYTLNGSDPFELNLRDEPIGTVYTGPILISRTTPLRAGALLRAWKPSEVVTHSYIFPDDVIRQPANPAGFPDRWGGRTADYAMDQRVVNDPAYSNEIKEDLKSTPSVCIIIPNTDFFESGGIYANPTRTGDQWERAASMEWIDPNTGEHFGVNVGLRIHGGPYSRSGNLKNALRVIFRNEYGLSKLEYPLFPDTEVETFNTLTLRSIWNYSWSGHSGMSGPRHADYLRDVFARDSVRDMGRFTPYGRPVQVYINGLYWGLYIMTERPDEHFVADHLGGDSENYDVLEAPTVMGGSTNMEVKAGGQQAKQAWNNLFAMADTDLTTSEGYEAMQALVDIPAMIDYMLMIYYVGSRDAPVFLGDSYTPRNFFAVRLREPAGPFIIVPWDTEWALEYSTTNRVNVVGVWNPHYLIDRLLDNSEFRMLLADHIHRHFFNDGALTREQTTQRYMDRADEIFGAIVGESARWGDEPRPSRPYTRDAEWIEERNRLVNEFFFVRTDIVMNQLRQAGFYPSVSAPEFYVSGESRHGGYINATDTISMTAEKDTIWFTLDGTDPRQAGIQTEPSNQITLVPENTSKFVLVPTGTISNNWKGGGTFNHTPWISGTGGIGYERNSGYEQYIGIDIENQMYGTNTTCYIRIPFNFHPGENDLNSLTLKIRYDDGFIAYLNGVEIARRNFTGTPGWNSYAETIHNDSEAINFENIDISLYIDELLSDDNILAIHGLNQSLTSSDFLISAELVAYTDNSSSVVDIPTGIIEYTGPISLTESTHVKARVLDNGTWSALNEATYAVGPVAKNLRITELMYHPFSSPGLDDPNEEFIELTNIGVETINLNLVKFTNGIDFIFPSLELAPGEYVVVIQDIDAFEARYGTEINIAGQYTGRLANNGERIRLEDALSQTILDFSYKDGWFDSTDGQGFSLTIQNPANPDPQTWDSKSAWHPSITLYGSPGGA